MTDIKKIETLTEEQEQLLEKVADEWINRALYGRTQVNKIKAMNGVDFLYGLDGLKPPQIVICADPMDMFIAAHETGAPVKKEGEYLDYFGLGHDAGWTACGDYFQRIGIDLSEFEFEKWLVFLDSGIWGSLFYENIAFVCGFPSEVHVNSDGNLHNQNDMAIKWPSCWGLYFLNGVAVDDFVITTPAEKLDARIILKEKNAEVRREIVRKIGIERIIVQLGAKSLDKQGDYELLLLNLDDGNSRPYLKMRNPSIATWHLEGVPPNIKTVAEALAWRNDRQDSPEILT